jgi:hypothetical protein
VEPCATPETAAALRVVTVKALRATAKAKSDGMVGSGGRNRSPIFRTPCASLALWPILDFCEARTDRALDRVVILDRQGKGFSHLTGLA